MVLCAWVHLPVVLRLGRPRPFQICDVAPQVHGCLSRVSAGRAAARGVSPCGLCASRMELRGAAFGGGPDVVSPDGTPIMTKMGLGGGFQAFDCLAVTDLGRGRRARGVRRGGCPGIPWCGRGLGPTRWRPPWSLQAPCVGFGRRREVCVGTIFSRGGRAFILEN